MKRIHGNRGFTLVEIAVSIVLIGLVLLAFAGMTSVVQKSAGRTRQYADAQQNARAALDFVTAQLRAAGSDVAAYDGQGTIVHAGPNQVAFNADIDGGAVIDGEQPLTALDVSQSPNTVPSTGTAIYAPTKTFDCGAETIVFTLDSDESGVVDTGDQGDNDEENGVNPHLYVLKQYRYGSSGGSNEVRDSDVAIIRGPVAYDNGDNPPPLFEYYYDDDNDLSTPDLLWGDDDGDLDLSSSEIAALTDMPSDLLFGIRMIKVNVVAEGTQRSNSDNQGFAHVVMTSRVYIRNADSRDSAQIYGTVYYDANANGQRDGGETGIPNVLLTAYSLGRKTSTDQFGQYNIPVDGGTYTVKETVPSGYSPTTSASVSVTINNGETKNVDFGNKSSLDAGYVVGTVWDDVNKNAVNDGELGIADVVVELDNGMSGKTRADGYYRITAPLGSYTVTEIDPVGYSSTTANSASVTLASAGDSVVVNFGDAFGGTQGTLNGYVYIDEDKNGLRGGGEQGIPDVSLTLSTGENVVTDAAGFYTVDLDPGKYDVYELDADGYTSTTPNIVYGLVIETGKVVSQDFGDIPMKDISFVEVAVSDTKRPLSVSVGDMKEDAWGDPDIVMGTPSSSTNNMYVWFNQYTSPSTPLTSLFASTPTLNKKATNDVNAVRWMERNGDTYMDVITGVESSGNNLQEWYNDDKKQDLGKASNAPSKTVSSGTSSATTRLRIADLNGDGMRDLVVGLKSKIATWAGGFDARLALSPGSFASEQVVTTNGKATVLGIVAGIAAADMDKDGDTDLVIASNNGNYWGHVDIFKGDGTGAFVWYKRLLAKAGVNDVAVIDLFNDGLLLPDILVGISEAQNVGGVQVWYNNDGVFGEYDNSGYTYNADEEPRVPDEFYSTSGEALAVSTAYLDLDLFPDIMIGTRTSSFYTGDLLVVQAPGTKNEKVTNVKVNVAGEVVTVEVGDMNKDTFNDLVVTTRTSASAGKLAIYFLNDPNLFP
jgi:prepilin-type N-terminal cleavage/methylation domain-containing protein